MEGRVMVCEGTGLPKDQREFVEHYVVLSKSTLSLHDKKPGMFHRGSANSLFSISLSSTSFSEITSSSSSSPERDGGVGVEFLSGSNEINVNLPDGRLFVFTWNSTRKYDDWVEAFKKVFRRSADVVGKDGGGDGKRDNKKEKKEKKEKLKKEKSEKRGVKTQHCANTKVDVYGVTPARCRKVN
eukprot:TRINITY_DN5958_c0_g1_i1.p1 TRINITY_DN5958_c0_g1~~TRINITY_DN5958_c0_g1_i1.p1  ORF type:complete len:184 (-),score=35.32 TRINITY_DN5958_c0_g1_i1:78-629(-)